MYDGSGEAPVVADVAITGDRIAAIGDLADASADVDLDVTGLAVSPGFINMLSWATLSLRIDGRSMSDIRQGVTLEVFGEGISFGPLSDPMAKAWRERQGAFEYEVDWRSFGEGLESLVRGGISPNIASFVGATTIRIHELGYENRAPSPAELDRMRSLVREAMKEGALGVGSSLIYAPAFYASTDELIELSKVAHEYDGLYISHIRDEGNQFLEALGEFLDIARGSGVRAEIYHFKVKGEKNWAKLDQAIDLVEEARREGLEVTADMYNYAASSTGLNATMPPWVQEGGYAAWVERLKDPETRERVKREMRRPAIGWTNNLELAGSPENVLLVGFRNEALRELTGRTLAEVARIRGTSAEDAIIDLVIEDGSSVDAVYFLMDEANLHKKVALPWMSFGSDASSEAPEGIFLDSQPHPRTYGNFARLLGKYVREQGVISLAEAIRKLTALPAHNLRLVDRGQLKPGFFADIAVFDPELVEDHATFDDPHQLASGFVHVLVNGVPVLLAGEHTGATPGRVVRGPGYSQP